MLKECIILQRICDNVEKNYISSLHLSDTIYYNWMKCSIITITVVSKPSFPLEKLTDAELNRDLKILLQWLLNMDKLNTAQVLCNLDYGGQPILGWLDHCTIL